mmetsp:Transcript_20466/g.44326  ORF Transcript_20466/g.44326 Transcript_20466/m.44326 type:complete len:187 (-) Transcript_20466:41-601(-)
MARATNNNKKVKVTKVKTSSPKMGQGGPQKILDFALFFETELGNPRVPRKRMAAVSGVKPNTFPVTISNMKKKGLIVYDKEAIWLTQQGRSKAQVGTMTEASMDNGQTQQELKQKFKIGGKAAVLFDILKDGRDHDRQATIGQLDFASKASAAVMLSNLKKTGVIEYDKTTIKMTDMCFPFGRPGN